MPVALPSKTCRTSLAARPEGATQTHAAVLFSRIGPYHYARIKAATMHLQVSAVEFSNVDSTYAWDLVSASEGFHRTNLFAEALPHELSTSQVVARVTEVLDQIQPQVVALPGWSDRCSLAALHWCSRHSVPAVMMSESTAWDDPRTAWKERVKRRLIGLCSAGLAGGQPHADYLTQLGLPAERIFLGYDAVDNNYFSAQVAAVRSRESEIRRHLEVPENYFLASARFVEKKNLARLLEAYARYRTLAAKSASGQRQSAIWRLVLLGDGPLRPTLNSQLATLNLLEHVQMPGFKQYDELPKYYGLARVFVHASTTEQWGLVVNEAMASGLPVLVSSRCGCAADLVQEGVNGFTFDPYDVERLAQLMLKFSAANFPLDQFGEASSRIIASWGTERFAAGLSQAVATAWKSPVASPGCFDRLLLRLLMLR